MDMITSPFRNRLCRERSYGILDRLPVTESLRKRNVIYDAITHNEKQRTNIIHDAL